MIGAVDCTHVGMKPPSINDYAYINRKSYHSVNFPIICDARMSILNMVARWPGGTHDSFIFQNSNVVHRLHQGALHGQSHLLGELRCSHTFFSLEKRLRHRTKSLM